ncbi:MAG: hypothetical protein II984_08855, partial [Clostridia bacterium]|nr:hypothetical protein [Clostridia bacterium]
KYKPIKTNGNPNNGKILNADESASFVAKKALITQNIENESHTIPNNVVKISFTVKTNRLQGLSHHKISSFTSK